MGVCGRIDPFQVVLEDVRICIILADTVAPGWKKGEPSLHIRDGWVGPFFPLDLCAAQLS